jgi:hypothetical protein
MNIIWIKTGNHKFEKIDAMKIKRIESVPYTAEVRRFDIVMDNDELIKIFERNDNQFFLYDVFTEFVKDVMEYRDVQTALKHLIEGITIYNERMEDK